jgi:hypothetical protein
MDVPLISSLTSKERTHEHHAYISLYKLIGNGLPSWLRSLSIEAPTPHPSLIFSQRKSGAAILPLLFASMLLVSGRIPHAIPQRA